MSRVIDFHRRRATARFNARMEAERRRAELRGAWVYATVGWFTAIAMLIWAMAQ